MSSYTEEVYQAIYEKILDGTLPPGAKLHIAKLAAMFDVGLSPIREALSRLTATDLVVVVSQRGFRVVPLSIEDLNDIYTTRTLIEKMALKLSIEKGDINWEATLMAAFHRLSQYEQMTLVSSLEEYQRWEKYHRDFNFSLIAACGLKHLLEIQSKLYQQTERYRRIWFLAGLKKQKALPTLTTQKDILDAVLKRDEKKALLLLEKHFEKAKKLIAENI